MGGTLKSAGTISGSLSSAQALNGELSSTKGLSGNLAILKAEIVEGTYDYSELINKPSIENVELDGNKTFSDLGLDSIDNSELMNLLTF